MQYDFQFPANGGQDIAAKGAYVKYKAGLGAIRVKFSTGGFVDLTPGQGVRMPVLFNSVNVSDRSASGNAGVLLIGDYDFQDDSIAGTVSVIDGGVSSTLADKCFLASVSMPISAAGKWAAAYLTNPSASGKNVILQSASISSFNTGTMTVHSIANGAPGGGNFSASNKNIYTGGGTPSTAKLWGFEESSLALLGKEGRKEVVLANTTRDFEVREPVIIRPGVSFALVFGGTAGAAGAFANFEFREEPI